MSKHVVRAIDGKFGIRNDYKIVNLVSEQEIPEDEPLFLLRARDHHAIETLEYYKSLCERDCNELHIAGIEGRIVAFTAFAQQQPEKMKQAGGHATPETLILIPAMQVVHLTANKVYKIS